MNEITLKFGTERPELTVMIPMFRGRYIGWVALESLIRQRGKIPPWELIIAEEQNDETMGFDAIRPFLDRGLLEHNCKRLTYFALDKWIPLGSKMNLMASAADPYSIAYIFHAADYYSTPMRLVETYEAFKNPKTLWFIPPKMYIYNVQKPDHILFVDKGKAERRDDTSGKAIRGWLVRRIKNYLEGVPHGVDGLIRRSVERILAKPVDFTVNESESWRHNLVVNGFGTLSNRRVHKRFRRPQNWNGASSVFSGCLQEIVPAEIAYKLERAHDYIRKHNSTRGALG